MSLNLLKINEQNSLRARKDLLIIVNCKMRDLAQKGWKWMWLLKMMMEIAIVQWPSRSFQIEVIIAQHRKKNENRCFFSLFLSKVNINYDLGSSDDKQRWNYFFFLNSWWLPILWLWWSSIASRVSAWNCHFCPNYRHV